MVKISEQDAYKLIGKSAAFQSALEKVSQLAPLNKPVLIIGERGTGKELMAQRLHFLSPNWDKVLIKLNCAAIPENLLESELFGHEAGAFTGASKRHIGRFEQAHGGTLFLDEIANMSLRLQEKLLRVVEYGEFERVGGRETLQVDVRIVGAANMDLPQMVRDGKFRADLLDRLSFDVVTLPPLRYRREDILPLARYFATAMIKELRRDFFAGFSDHATQLLEEYEWPGNIRELKNVIERAVYRTALDEVIEDIEFDPFQSPFRPLGDRSPSPPVAVPDAEEIPSANQLTDKAGLDSANAEAQAAVPVAKPIAGFVMPQDFKAYIQQMEQQILTQALSAHRYNQRKTAQAIGLSYHQMRAYLRKYPELVKPRFRS